MVCFQLVSIYCYFLNQFGVTIFMPVPHNRREWIDSEFMNAPAFIWFHRSQTTERNYPTAVWIWIDYSIRSFIFLFKFLIWSIRFFVVFLLLFSKSIFCSCFISFLCNRGEWIDRRFMNATWFHFILSAADDVLNTGWNLNMLLISNKKFDLILFYFFKLFISSI